MKRKWLQKKNDLREVEKKEFRWMVAGGGCV